MLLVHINEACIYKKSGLSFFFYFIEKYILTVTGACSDGRVVLGAATDGTLSPTTAWVQIPVWACVKVASDFGLGGGFRRVLQFPPLLTTASHELAKIWHKCDEKRNSKSKSTMRDVDMIKCVFFLSWSQMQLI